MKLHLYHCSQAIIRDRTQHTKSSRPVPYSFPENAGESDFVFKPEAKYLLESDLREITEEFQSIPFERLFNGKKTAISINYEYLSRKLEIPIETVKYRLKRLKQLDLIPGLTIDYNFEQWMRQSLVKGCIVIMAFVEKKDYDTSEEILSKSFTKVVIEVRNNILDEHGKYQLNRICVIPNAHLSNPGELGPDPDRNINILQSCRNNLAENQLKVFLASYGYAKNLDLVLEHYHIHGHKIGYLFRSI